MELSDWRVGICDMWEAAFGYPRYIRNGMAESEGVMESELGWSASGWAFTLGAMA